MSSVSTINKTSTLPLSSARSEDKVLQQWTTVKGDVRLLVEKTGAIYAQLLTNDHTFFIPQWRIEGFPKNILQKRMSPEFYLKDTYIQVGHSQGLYSITINARLRGGMFSPKSWGRATATFFGENVVYTAGAAMGHSRIHVAATQGNHEDVKNFIKAGDDINMVNTKGNTPLDDAIRERHTAIEKTLRENGAKRSNEL